MNAAINVSVAVATSHPIAARAPVVSSRTMTPPRVPFWPPKMFTRTRYLKKPAGACDVRHRSRRLCQPAIRKEKAPTESGLER